MWSKERPTVQTSADSVRWHIVVTVLHWCSDVIKYKLKFTVTKQTEQNHRACAIAVAVEQHCPAVPTPAIWQYFHWQCAANMRWHSLMYVSNIFPHTCSRECRPPHKHNRKVTLKSEGELPTNGNRVVSSHKCTCLVDCPSRLQGRITNTAKEQKSQTSKLTEVLQSKQPHTCTKLSVHIGVPGVKRPQEILQKTRWTQLTTHRMNSCTPSWISFTRSKEPG